MKQKNTISLFAIVVIAGAFMLAGCGNNHSLQSKSINEPGKSARPITIEKGDVVPADVDILAGTTGRGNHSPFPADYYELTVMNPDGIVNGPVDDVNNPLADAYLSPMTGKPHPLPKVSQKFKAGDVCKIKSKGEFKVIGIEDSSDIQTKRVLVQYITAAHAEQDYCPPKTLSFLKYLKVAELKGASERKEAERQDLEHNLAHDLALVKQLLAEEHTQKQTKLMNKKIEDGR